MTISVIIPAYNEEDVIARTVGRVYRLAHPSLLKEIIVADGGSTDETVKQAAAAGAKVLKSSKGRAVQMNCGAGRASGDVLYFLHADSLPPSGFDRSIIQNIRSGYPAGCFRLSFDHDHFLLRLYAWFTRFDIDAFRFGDQSLFITKEMFAKLGGFREDHILMEDNEIVRRIKKESVFKIVPKHVTTSARKYLEVGVLKLQVIFSMVFLAYHLGASQSTLVSLYKKFA